MKQHLRIALILITILSTQSIKADEGMWLLPLIEKLNINRMQEMGLKLSAKEIYDVNHSSVKDAVIMFGGGCTGEIISNQGLILTNHHCGYSHIQKLSSIEHNYLKNGFWAYSKEEEIPAPGLTASFLINMENVTDSVLHNIPTNSTPEERQKIIKKNIQEMVTKATKNNHYKASIKSFYEGNQYYLTVYEKFQDIRFVGAPPSSIGKFGHDTDNWVWPRHTGDFSLFRIYCDENGQPATYSTDNIPYTPKHHLPITLNGIQKDDFSMTVGYPGSTNRYLSSWGIKERMEIINKSRIVPRGKKLAIWNKEMLADEKIQLQYASKYSGSSNYWKNSIGMNKALDKLNVIDEKKALEDSLTQWINAEPERKEKYGNVLTNLETTYTNRSEMLLAFYYTLECLQKGIEIFSFAANAAPIEDALQLRDKEELEKAVNDFRKKATSFYKNYHAPTDKKACSALLKLYFRDVNKTHHPSIFNEIENRYNNNFEAYSKRVFKKTIFASETDLNKFLANPKLNALKNDPAYIAGQSINDLYRTLYSERKETESIVSHNNRLFMAAIMEMQTDKTFYPDANFTIRLSYGKIGDYAPVDGVKFKHFTTLKGVMEKEIPGNHEFTVPQKLQELYNKKDYGRYANKDGQMYVCFTSNNDITGGNSGSPVINAKGELFGLAFDGNWEAMSGDILFETQLQKCISVDIRYVLFIIDKFAGARNLIDEMTIIE